MRLAFACFLLCLLAAPALAQDEKPKVAILPFDVGMEQKFAALKEGLPDILAACFTAHAGTVEILDRSHIESIAAEATQNFTVRDIHLKAATHLLRGSIAPHEQGFVMTLMLYELASARLVADASAEGGMDGIASTACKGADALAGKMEKARPQPESGGGENGRETEEQGRLMIEGLGHYYNGAYEQAFPSFMKLLKRAPGNASARYWLGKSYHAAGMGGAARIEFQKFLGQFPDDPRSAEISSYLHPEKKE